MMQQPEECQGALRYEVGVGHLDTTALEEDDEEEEGCPWEPEEEEESLEETSWRSIAVDENIEVCSEVPQNVTVITSVAMKDASMAQHWEVLPRIDSVQSIHSTATSETVGSQGWDVVAEQQSEPSNTSEDKDIILEPEHGDESWDEVEGRGVVSISSAESSSDDEAWVTMPDMTEAGEPMACLPVG